jgi:hypothetical protein
MGIGFLRIDHRTTVAGQTVGCARCLLLCLLLAALTLPAAAWRKKKDAGPLCTARVRVLRSSDGRPVRNAGVVFQSLRADGSPEEDSYELKTNGEGFAAMTDLPCGGLRVQVIARGMRTFGEDLQISPEGKEIVVRLTKPVGQVSAY